MDGSNFPPGILTIEDARAYAAAIADDRTAQVAIAAQYAPMLDDLTEKLTECRSERDALMDPLAASEKAKRDVLAEWLKNDPDGSLKDVTGRVVATLSRKAGKPQIHAEQLPDAFKSMQPDMGKINLALAAGEKVPGVSVPVATILRVL